MGYNVDNTTVYTLQFAGGQVVTDQSKEGLDCMCRKLQEEYSKWGLTVNIAKTKYMSLGTDTIHLELDNGDIITGCTEFRYLGSIFTKAGRDIKIIRHRVTQARKVIGALNGVWWSKEKKKNRGKIICNSMVESVLICGAETWSLFEDGRRRIDAAEVDALRRSAGISTLDRKVNDCSREKMNAQDTILVEIIRKQLIWCGHVERMDPTRLPKIIINWKPEGRKTRGRPRRTRKDGIYRAMSERWDI
jgi:hypothetical protein